MNPIFPLRSPISRERRLKSAATAPRGQAMVEILVAIPVLILIFAAVLYLGEGYYRRADTIIAARYAVWADSRAGKSEVSEKDLARLFYGGEEMQERLKLKNAPDAEPFGINLLPGLSELLGGSSGTDGKTLTFTFRPRPGSQQNTMMASTHYLDGNTWRDNREPGNALRLITWGIAAARSGSQQSGSSGSLDFGDIGGAKVGKPF